MNALQTEIARDLKDALLIRAIQGGLPMVERPFAAIGQEIGVGEQQVIDRIAELTTNGDIKRFGVVVRHKELGYRANAMVVWDLPDEWVDRLGESIGHMPFVTLSYRRPRRLPDWPYNLFTMIHGRDRSAVLAQLEQIKQRMGLADVDCAVLFSGRRFKQCGARYGSEQTRQLADTPSRVLGFPCRQSVAGGDVKPSF